MGTILTRKITFGATTGNKVYPTDPHICAMSIPVSSYTQAQINSMWSGMSSSTTFATMVQNFLDYEIAGGGFPYFNPGRNSVDYSQTIDYSAAMQAVPKGTEFSGTLPTSVSNNFLAYCEDSQSGLFAQYGTSSEFYYNGTFVGVIGTGFTGDFGTLGFNMAYRTAITILFLSSDEKLGIVRLNNNKNNSFFINWANDTISSKFIQWFTALPEVHWADGQYSDPVTITEWEDYTRLVRKPGYTKLCRLRFLNPDGSTAFSLENDPYNRRSGAFIAAGNLNVNLQNGTRRTAEVTLNNADAEFDYNYNKVWFGTEIALDMGLVLTDGTEFYLPQGVFRVVNPTESVNPEGNTVHFQLSDKWSGLDGTLNGNLEASYIVNEGTNIFAPVSTLLASDRGDGQPFDRESPIFTEYYNGKTQALPDGTSVPLTNAPYDLVVDSDDGTIAELILQLCGMVNAWVGYDRSGRLRIDPSQDDIDDADKPVLWRFSMDETQLISMAYESKISDVKNDYIVVGMQASDYSQPAARVQNLDPQSDVNINLIGRRTKRESRPEFATQQICEDYAVWMAKRTAVLHKAVTISCSQLFHLEENGLIEIIRTDKDPAVAELHLIQGFSIPLATDQPMSITATSVNDFPDITITTWPPEE